MSADFGTSLRRPDQHTCLSSSHQGAHVKRLHLYLHQHHRNSTPRMTLEPKFSPGIAWLTVRRVLVFAAMASFTTSVNAGLFDKPVYQHAGSFTETTRLPNPTEPSYFRPISEIGPVLRGQSEGGVPIPPGTTAPANSGIFAPLTGQPPVTTWTDPALSQPSTWNAFSPPISSDPFVTDPSLGQVAPYAPYTPYGAQPFGASPGGMNMPFSTYGVNGPAPYRMGWQNRIDLEYMPEASVNNRPGNFGQFGVDYDLAWTGPFMPGWILQWTNEFRLRNWDGPLGVPGLPGEAFRFGWDFELETPQNGPVSMSFGITPSINTDFGGSLSSTAFQLDGRALFLFTLDQYWSIALGAAYWDRVDDRLLPYAGLIYRDDFWEWRIMYPETTISLFLGNEAQWAKWAYIRAEYHVEAYEVNTGAGGMDEVELSDYRLLGGFKMNAGLYQWFIEAGWVFDREIDYGLPANGKITPDTGFIARAGWRY